MAFSKCIMILFVLTLFEIISCFTDAKNKECVSKEDELAKFLISTLTKIDKRLQDNQKMLQKTYGLLDNFIKWQQEQSLQNVALGKYAEQSSDFGPSARAGNTVDGYTSTFSATRFERTPYLWIDLAHEYSIKRIELVNRGECCGDRLNNVDVTVGSSLNVMALCAYFKGPAQNREHIVLDCKTPISGRFVKLAIRYGIGMMQIAELRVFAHRPY